MVAAAAGGGTAAYEMADIAVDMPVAAEVLAAVAEPAVAAPAVVAVPLAAAPAAVAAVEVFHPSRVR